MRFYLGTIEAHWLRRSRHPLMVSQRRLRRRFPTLPATVDWILDSGGFTELSMHGRWTYPAAAYAELVDDAAVRLGRLEWAAPQDWMCEPAIRALTGLSVEEHQHRTIASVHELRRLCSAPVIPVLQGWTLDDYLRHVDLYAAAGLPLGQEPVVGLGSVCRRQSTAEIESIVTVLHDELGPRLHGFGVKTLGLSRYGPLLASADSMAWSYNGRRNPTPGHAHRSCAHCLPFAMSWADRIVGRPEQHRLPFG